MKKKKALKNEFYVPVADPQTIRHPLLECRKYTLESMRVFQHIKHIRMQKIQEKKNLR